jgi:hypothetical protein
MRTTDGNVANALEAVLANTVFQALKNKMFF